MIGENLLRFNKEQKYLFFDLETCNLNLVNKENVPWQYGFSTGTIDKIEFSCDYLVKWPEIKISKQAAFLTRFDQSKVDRFGISPQKALEQFEKYLYDPQYIIVAHNGLGFDIYLHNIHRKLMGKKSDYSYLNRFLDTNALAKTVAMGVHPQPNEDLLTFQYKFLDARFAKVKTSIKALCQQLDIDYDEEKAHDAQQDILWMFKIFNKLIWKIKLTNENTENK